MEGPAPSGPKHQSRSAQNRFQTPLAACFEPFAKAFLMRFAIGGIRFETFSIFVLPRTFLPVISFCV